MAGRFPGMYSFTNMPGSGTRRRRSRSSPNASRSYYKTCFVKHLLPRFGMQHMKAITAVQIQEFVNGFAGTSKSQINNVIGTLKAIFASAYAEGLIERDPTVALIRPKASKGTGRRALTPEETQRVLETIRTHPEGLFLAILYYLGVRRGEALGLKWEISTLLSIRYTSSGISTLPVPPPPMARSRRRPPTALSRFQKI